MQPENKERLSRIEELKSKLFSKNFKTTIEHRDSFSHRHNEEVTDSWVVQDSGIVNMSHKFFMKTSFFKKFFIASAIFFATAVLYGAYMFFGGGNTVSNDNIDITVIGNTFTAGGEELPLQIGITNRNNLPLDLVDLVIEYPKNSSGDLTGETERIRQSLGTIPAGAVRNENVKVILFGGQGSMRPIRITLEYRVEGSNAIFVKEKLYEVSINSTPINLTIDGPTEVNPNQEIVFKVKTTLNSTRPATQILLKADYPVGFQFISSEPQPTSGNNAWGLGDLAPGTEREISIVGKMVDVFDGEEKNFRVTSGSQSKSDKSQIDVIYNSIDHKVVVKRPFIEATLSMNGKTSREYAIDSKSVATARINWSNHSDTKVNNLEIRAKISGNAIDRKSIRPEQGFFDSATNTIVWNKTYISGLQEVSPGEGGSVAFSFSPLPLVSSGAGVTSSPSAVVDVSISGQQEVLGFESQELKNQSSATIRVVSDVGFATKILHFTGPLTNTGPIPPKVEKETTYTVVWTLSNSANPISGAAVKASLPAWVKFVGPISPAGEDLTYNSTTRELIWKVGTLKYGTGISSPAKEIYFRIAISPSLSQLGSTPTLVNEAILTGLDDFAKVNVRVVKGPSFTRVTETGFPANGDRVTE